MMLTVASTDPFNPAVDRIKTVPPTNETFDGRNREDARAGPFKQRRTPLRERPGGRRRCLISTLISRLGDDPRAPRGRSAYSNQAPLLGPRSHTHAGSRSAAAYKESFLAGELLSTL